MGCRPSRSSLGRVADCTSEYNKSYLSEFDKARRKRKRNAAKNRRKAPTYSQFSSTSKTYDHHSRMSKITLRLSTDGSMLEIEQFDLDLIQEPKADAISEYSSDGLSNDDVEAGDKDLNGSDNRGNVNMRCESAPLLRSHDDMDLMTGCLGKKLSTELDECCDKGEIEHNTSNSNTSLNTNTKETDCNSSRYRDHDLSEDLDNQSFQIKEGIQNNENSNRKHVCSNMNCENNITTSRQNTIRDDDSKNGNDVSQNRCQHNTNIDLSIPDRIDHCQLCVIDTNANVLSSSTHSTDSNGTPVTGITPNGLCSKAMLVCLGHRDASYKTNNAKNRDHTFDTCTCMCSQCCENIIVTQNSVNCNTVISTCGETLSNKLYANLSACCISSHDSPITPLNAKPTLAQNFQYCQKSILQTDSDSIAAFSDENSKYIPYVGRPRGEDPINTDVYTNLSNMADLCHIKGIQEHTLKENISSDHSYETWRSRAAALNSHHVVIATIKQAPLIGMEKEVSYKHTLIEVQNDDEFFQDTCTCELCSLNNENPEFGEFDENVLKEESSDLNDNNDVSGDGDSDVYSDRDDKESDVSDCERIGQVVTSVLDQNGGTMYIFTDTENDGDVDSSDDDRDVYIDAVDRTYV